MATADLVIWLALVICFTVIVITVIVRSTHQLSQHTETAAYSMLEGKEFTAPVWETYTSTSLNDNEIAFVENGNLVIQKN